MVSHKDSMGDRLATQPTDEAARLMAENADLRRQLAQITDSQAVQRQAFDHLYEEMRQYKDDFIFQAEKPLLLDLLLFYDSLNWFKNSLVNQEMSPDVIADSFQYLLDEFLELLYRRDVIPMDSKEAFDRTSQKAIKVVHTDRQDWDYRVQQVLKRGFSRGERMLRAEEVVLCRYRARHDDAPSSHNGD